MKNKEKILLVYVCFVIITFLWIDIFLDRYSSYNAQILYEGRMNQVKQVTTLFFTRIEDVSKDHRTVDKYAPYLECRAFDGKPVTYIVDSQGELLFCREDKAEEPLWEGSLYHVLNNMEYLHGSSCELVRRTLETTGKTCFHVYWQGTEYYCALYNMENEDWTLFFLVPAEAVAANTEQLIHATVSMVLVFMGVLVLISSFFIFYTMHLQHKEVLKAERRHNEELSDAVLAAQTAYHAAQSANHAKSVFLANISHDIRTPMNAVIGLVSLLERDTQQSGTAKEYISNLKAASRHLLEIINNILDMSMIENSTVVMNTSEFDIRDILEQLRVTFEAQAKTKEQTLVISIQQVQHEWLCGDRCRVLQILGNLLSNALKYTPNGGCVSLDVSELEQTSGHYARLCFHIRDNGIGMSEEYLDRIYEAFSRENNMQMDAIQGTGLGMYIVKNMVDLMGGSIQVESTPGEGSCFEVLLDFHIADKKQEAEKGECDSNVQTGRLPGIRFLCAEDNPMNAEILQDLLQLEGADCDICTDGRQVVDKFEHSQPGEYDMILMDIRMPVMNGYEAAKAIRHSSHPMAGKIPIIALTANAFSEDVQKSLTVGMTMHLTKPVDIDLLVEAVRLYVSHTSCEE